MPRAMLDVCESAAKIAELFPLHQRAYILVGASNQINNSNCKAVIMKSQKILNYRTYKIEISAVRETDC